LHGLKEDDSIMIPHDGNVNLTLSNLVKIRSRSLLFF